MAVFKRKPKPSPHGKTPCSTCPYRRDVPLGHWDAVEFEKVLASERVMFGAVFGCHGHINLDPKERGLCIGYVLDQRERGIPNLALRLKILSDPEVERAVEEAHSDGVEMFGSAEEMCKLNLRVIAIGRK